MSTAPSVPQPWPVQRASELLDRLAQEVQRAAKRADADVIHDVRVAIRRLRQCLDMFASFFPARASKKLGKESHKLLKAAGEVRNLDIAIDMLKKARLARTGPLVRDIRKDRDKSEKDFAQAIAKLHGGRIGGKWREKLTAAAQDTTLTCDSRTILPSMAAELFDAGELAADASASPTTLHKFRIKTKKFRYTLELFAPFGSAGFGAHLRVLRNLQQRLGDINDYAASRRILKNYRDGHCELVDRALERLQGMAAAETKSFRSYFRKALGPKQKELWIRDLSEAKPN